MICLFTSMIAIIVLIVCFCLEVILNKNKQLPKKLRIYYNGSQYILQGKRFIHWKKLSPHIEVGNSTFEVKVTHFDVDFAHTEMKRLITWYKGAKSYAKKKVIKEYDRDNNC